MRPECACAPCRLGQNEGSAGRASADIYGVPATLRRLGNGKNLPPRPLPIAGPRGMNNRREDGARTGR